MNPYTYLKLHKIFGKYINKIMKGNCFLWYSSDPHVRAVTYKTITGKIVFVTDATALPIPFAKFKNPRFVGIGKYFSL